MEVTVRKAEIKDIEKVSKLLSEVLELHAKLRPDIFISGTTKYTKEELTNIFKNDILLLLVFLGFVLDKTYIKYKK